MTASDARTKLLKKILSELSELKGVKHAFYLPDPVRPALERIERDYAGRGPLTVHNEGVSECLRRKHVICIVKDKSFRPPPHPTVLLVDDDGAIIGKELLPGEKLVVKPGVRLINLGKDFVIFYDGRKAANARFILPPIRFREAEEIEWTKNVCSSSPSSAGDLYIKKRQKLPDDPKLATVLVGFDLEDE